MNHVDTIKLKMYSLYIGDYHVNFPSRHIDDSHLFDDIARWWTEWHEYHLNEQNVPVYVTRILFGSKLR